MANQRFQGRQTVHRKALGVGKKWKRKSKLTVVLGVAAHAETSGFDVGETESDGLAEGSGVDVRDIVQVADSAVRVVKTLSRDVSVWVRGVIGRKPGRKEGKKGKASVIDSVPATKATFFMQGSGSSVCVHSPCLNEDLLCAIRRSGCGGRADVDGELLELRFGAEGHAPERGHDGARMVEWRRAEGAMGGHLVRMESAIAALAVETAGVVGGLLLLLMVMCHACGARVLLMGARVCKVHGEVVGFSL